MPCVASLNFEAHAVTKIFKNQLHPFLVMWKLSSKHHNASDKRWKMRGKGTGEFLIKSLSFSTQKNVFEAARPVTKKWSF